MRSDSSKSFMYYFIVGVVATLTDWITFYTLTTFSSLFYQLSLTISFFLGSVVKFFLNKRYTFKNESKKIISQYLTYMIMVLISYFLSVLLMHVFVEWLSIHAFISRVFTTFIVLFFGYVFDKNLTFNEGLFS